MTDTAEILRHSVTADDYTDFRRTGVMQFSVWNMTRQGPGLTPEPPAYWSQARDFVLRSTVQYESYWAGALGIAISKTASLGFEFTGDGPQLIKRAQQMLLNADMGRGYVHFLSKSLRDYMTTDNGSIIELVRASSARGSRILGIVHLDSCRCIRTGDAEIPIVYRDRMGAEHELKAHQVLMLSDMPDPSDMLNGVGFCAASRAYSTIYLLASVQKYISEKVSGSGATGIEFIGGIGDKQMEAGLVSAREEQNRRGAYLYMGKILIPVPSDVPLTNISVNLRDLPDGFNRKEELDAALLSYANAIGLDPQDLQPLTGQALGTGAQSQVLDDKANGRGLAAWRQDFLHQLNEFVHPDSITQVFIENDYRDKLQAAQISGERATNAKTLTEAGIITPQQALQVLIDQDELPREFLPEDTTPEQTLSDLEKPEELNMEPAPATPPATLLPPQTTQKADEGNYPPELAALLAAASDEIAALTARLEAGEITVDAWVSDVMAVLGRATAGINIPTTGQYLQEQAGYLLDFAEAIRNGTATGIPARAQMYAESLKAPWWQARTVGLPLPAWPGDGTTQCLTNCKCSWDIQELEGNGNVDAYWRRGVTDSCQTCVQRQMDWSPLQIRDGVLL